MKPLSLSKIGNSNIFNNSSIKPSNNHINTKKYPMIKLSQNETKLLSSSGKNKYKTSKNSPEREQERNISEEKCINFKLKNNQLNPNNIANINPSVTNIINKSLIKANSHKIEFNEQEFFKSKLNKNKINSVITNSSKGESIVIHKQTHSLVSKFYPNKSVVTKDCSVKKSDKKDNYNDSLNDEHHLYLKMIDTKNPSFFDNGKLEKTKKTTIPDSQVNTPQGTKQLDNLFESRKFSLESGKNDNKKTFGVTQISNKIILKSNSQSNNQDPTSIIDNLKSEKLRIITASKYAPNLLINLNHFPSASKNEPTNFSRKSSPHNRICSDIPNSHLNLKNIAKNNILSNQSVALKLNDNTSRKYQISTNVAIPIFCRKKTEVQKEPVIVDIDIKKQSSETNNKFVATLNQLKGNILINKKHSTTTNSPKNKNTNIKSTAVNNNFIQNKQAPTNSLPITQRLKDEAKNKSVISTKINLNDIKVKNQEKNPKTEFNIIENSLENILETSNCSVISTARESNYYYKEFEKLCKYIKNCIKPNKLVYLKNTEYPTSNIKFYKYGRLIGKGAFGKVNLGLHVATGRLVAMKSFNKKNVTEKANKKIIYETKLMKNLKHNSIIKILDFFENEKYIMIVMEYIYGGDLLSFVRKRTKLSEITAKLIFIQIIEGLQYIHSQNIVHRDIKLDNILIDLNNNIKICDFGISKQIKKGDVLYDQCGTPAYIAPEILKNLGYEGFSVDIWSAGVVLYAMLSGTVPFKASNMNELHKLITKGNPATINDISDEANDLINRILEVEPKKRITIEQILEHPWVKINDIHNGKIKAKIDIFTNAERILLSKSNIDFRKANKEDLIEHFTLKNLDTKNDLEIKNVKTKSYILAPFNSSLKKDSSLIDEDLKIENDVIKIFGKAKELNRNYELNNNGEIDNGILIKDNNKDPLSNHESPFLSPNPSLKEKGNKILSKPISPQNEIVSDFKSNQTSPHNQRQSRKTLSKENTSTNTFVIDENALRLVEEVGYKRDYILKSLLNNDLNYAVASYFLSLNSKTD